MKRNDAAEPLPREAEALLQFIEEVVGREANILKNKPGGRVDYIESNRYRNRKMREARVLVEALARATALPAELP